MTISLRDVAVQQFRDQFHLLYAAAREITNTTMEVRNVVGDAYLWPEMGSAPMILRGASQSIIPASDVSHPRITTTFDNFVLNLPTDIFDQAEVNADERSMLAVRHVEAAGRREDQFVIDALDASSASLIVDSGTNMTVAKLREASAKLNAQNVPKNDRTILIHADQLEALLGEAEVTNSDFNTIKALVQGDLHTFLGFKFITLGNRDDEGGLPKTGNIRTCFVYHKRSMGMAWSINPMINVTFENLLQSWVSISRLRAGASALLTEGIVKIACDETA